MTHSSTGALPVGPTNMLIKCPLCDSLIKFNDDIANYTIAHACSTDPINGFIMRSSASKLFFRIGKYDIQYHIYPNEMIINISTENIERKINKFSLKIDSYDIIKTEFEIESLLIFN